ncbi:IPTL-CTERM sorting domain-containing protein [Candidatus Methylopumilus turicensis]|uniref:Conserved repeat domain protein n=1 Tax=Candidatus Methylopumilus turicensis TaxID=1581680 RepID=A0A0B7IVL3_9PROT|nr:IPTL-CTERM sorting domain-containing protein [Candidatus Methylopumilus turicensis]CEN56265.1 Conserved repeat domain protein [Candidatus Methylopumilus turicensis]
MAPVNTIRLIGVFYLTLLMQQVFSQPAMAGVTLSTELTDKVNLELAAGNPVDLIIEYDDAEIETVTKTMRNRLAKRRDNDEIRAYKVEKYKALKDRVDLPTRRPEIEDLQSYSHLPMGFKRFKSKVALEAFIAQAGVKAMYINEKMHLISIQNSSLINQTFSYKLGKQGAGTTVVVIDNGLDYTKSDFGSCTGIGSPASCKVIASIDQVTSNRIIGSRQAATNHDHGNNVAGTIIGVAPGSKIAAINVFDTASGAYSNDIISAINWGISNQGKYNIASINLSLGGDTKYTSPCSNDWSSSTITSAKTAGISVVIAAGNGGYTDGLISPACSPDAVSVGAVYDSNEGGISWGTGCTDATTAADQVVCFSNSANFLKILAPGVNITSAGIKLSGTSQAAPHVAGAIAVLRSAFPSETASQLQSRLTNTRVPRVTDTRNNLSFPRLDLLQALASLPTNNNFASASALSNTNNSGSVSSSSILSTKETGEPNHAGNTGGQSVWWKWTAPANGQLSLDTHDSNYDTLLAVYRGTTVNALSNVVANDNDGFGVGNSSVLLQAQAGQEYKIALDGRNGAAGFVQLNWKLNPSANANLSVSITGPNAISLGTQQPSIITVSNAGPQVATNVAVTTTLPAGATFVSSNANCSATNNIVHCLLGTLGVNSTASLTMQVHWNSIGSNTQLLASVSSDLPDSTQDNNAASIQVAMSDGSETGDSPTLPEWGMIFMMALMIAIGHKAQFRSLKLNSKMQNKGTGH